MPDTVEVNMLKVMAFEEAGEPGVYGIHMHMAAVPLGEKQSSPFHVELSIMICGFSADISRDVIIKKIDNGGSA